MRFFKFAFTLFIVCSLAGCDQALLDEGEQAAAELLKDPSSAQFRNVRTDGESYVCGEINGKNSFGAYNGFSEFYSFETVNGDWMATILDENQISDLPPELAQIARDNFETAEAKCDRDEERQDEIRERQLRQRCDGGQKSACDLLNLISE